MHRDQGGAALLVLLALLGLALGVVAFASFPTTQADRDQKTARSLAQARDLLVSRAAADLSRPGSLPCPDTDNDGDAESTVTGGGPCPDAVYVGRLPVETLEAPDLHDGDGERLWYALSSRFRDHPSGGALNSDTTGQLTVNGPVPTNQAIAIVFAPGPPLATQDRSGAGLTDVANYLEGENAGGIADTFEQQAPSTTFNDRILVITTDMLFPAVERRVAREARLCLQLLAATPTMSGHYPWAAPLTDIVDFADVSGTLFGRLPQTLVNSNASAVWPTPPHTNGSPGTEPTIQCLGSGTWWDYWRPHLFYAVAAAYAPTTTGSCPANCLSVNAVDSVAAVVMVAGRALAAPDQSGRSGSPTAASQFLEVGPASINNASGGPGFGRAPPVLAGPSQFNDKVECLHSTGGTFPC